MGVPVASHCSVSLSPTLTWTTSSLTRGLVRDAGTMYKFTLRCQLHILLLRQYGEQQITMHAIDNYII